jgi:hypothetical protein
MSNIDGGYTKKKTKGSKVTGGVTGLVGMFRINILLCDQRIEYSKWTFVSIQFTEYIRVSVHSSRSAFAILSVGSTNILL